VPDLSNPFFALILQGIEDAAQREGYAVLVGDCYGPHELGRYTQTGAQSLN
jgi:LacI family repressor for deo operon, udp, cdd, tsx, nupC, and nupG